MRRAFLSVVALMMGASLLTSCAGEVRADRELSSLLNKMIRQPRQYIYIEKPETGPSVSVSVERQDDLKYREVLSVDGAPAGEIVVIDDALAVKVMDPSKIPAFQGGAPAVTGSQVIGQALAGGQWVLDYQAAPSVFAPVNDRGKLILGTDPFLDAAYVFTHLRRAIDEAALVWRFNPDDLTVYRKSEDPFPLPDKGAQEQRIDILSPPLPGRSARGTASSLPSTTHFRRIAFYIQNDRIVRIRERVSVDDHPDFARARRGKAPKYFLTLLKAVKEGKTQDPIRERVLTVEIKAVGGEMKIELPPESVLSADLGGLLGSLGFGDAGTAAEPAATPALPGQPGGESPPPAEGAPPA